MKLKLYYLVIFINIIFFNNVCYSQKATTVFLKSHKIHIHYFVNDKKGDWEISPDVKPDRLKVYCDNEKISVKFKTDIDSIQFYITNKDTVRFTILLNDSIKAFTEVVGIKELPNSITVKDKLYYLSQFWSEAKYNFVNMDSTKFDWDSLYYSYINRVIDTKNDYDYYRQLKRFAATLKDGHTQIIDGGQFREYRDYIKLTLTDFDKKIYIVNINQKSGLDSSFLGAQLIEFNGMPINIYLDDSIFPYISSSTEQSLWMQGVLNLHSGFKNSQFQAKVNKTNGEIIAINLPYNGELTKNDNDLRWGVNPSRNENYVSFKWMQDTIAYVSISSFYPQEEVIKEFENCIDSIKKAKALIIDIRENGGGSTGVAWHIQSHLTNANYFFNFAYQTRIYNGVYKANGNWIDEYKDYYLNKALEYNKPDTIYISDTIYRVQLPTAILIGRYTFSAAEDLLVNFYEAPVRPVYIGESTGGSTGSPLVVPNFPNGGYGRICTRRVCFPYSGKPFINQGIIPDIFVKETIQNYFNNKDVVLDTAIQILKESINNKNNNYLVLTNDKLKQLGIDVTDKGIFYKNKNLNSKTINGFYCIKDNYCTIVRISENNKQSKINDKYFNKKDTTNNDFYPVLITNISEDRTYEQQIYKGKLLPILIDMNQCKATNRNDKIVIWFRVTDSLLKNLSYINKIENYIKLKTIN